MPALKSTLPHPVPSRAGALAILAILWAACFSGCVSDSPSHPDKTFTAAQRASCPDNPLKPAVQKAAAGPSETVNIHSEVYDSSGHFVTEWDTQYPPPSGTVSNLVWNGRDAAGNEVPSGYYFFVVAMSGSGATETRVECLFYVNSKDRV